MKDSPSNIEKLIQLKRYETPGEEYFTQFAESLKDRQRAELLRRSSLALVGERVSVWFQELGSARWLIPIGVGAAAAVMAISMPLIFQDSSAATGMANVKNQPVDNQESNAFELQLPRPSGRVPGSQDRPFADSPGKLNASVTGQLKEL